MPATYTLENALIKQLAKTRAEADQLEAVCRYLRGEVGRLEAVIAASDYCTKVSQAIAEQYAEDDHDDV